DGEPLTETNFDSSAPLRGAPGTSVELTIVRDGVAEPLTIEVQRETIRIASVRSRLLEPGFGYVRISAFQADTAAEFERQLGTLADEAGGALEGLVIDLRSNPGGLLSSAVQIADAL
ncbi:S41 family peptidase, partial [Lysobacter sp. D1-1-M9]|uniref:S41 family peptidase n=1 Tax=Novilysobacter longmucuonensis TaxID=3098603 RepID=UPI002FCAA4DF